MNCCKSRKVPTRLVALVTSWVVLSICISAANAQLRDVSTQQQAIPVQFCLKLYTRWREPDPNNKDRWLIKYQTRYWDGRKTAVIVCDMWNRHWCPGATKRVREMAPRVNLMLHALRKRGVLVIHAPSGTMEYYRDHPARKLALSVADFRPAKPIKSWCPLDPKREAPLPIDDSDGGCTESGPEPRQVWTHQIDAIEILPTDAIADGPEIFGLLARRGIDNVIITGVHVNMCVLGRPFGIRQMVYQGKNVVLVRDLTDSMYNPQRRPFVSHVRGTELVVEHIEKYWCPTITSSDFLGGPAFRFSEDKRPHVAFLVSDDHYHADKTLPQFAQMLREKYELYCTVMHGQGTADIPALDELQSADCLVLFIRRLALPAEQLAKVKQYLQNGGALVALRTASHAFDVRGSVPAGGAEWPEFDHEVLGGNYHNHAANELGCDVFVLPEYRNHPLLRGVEPYHWHSSGSLYYTSPVAKDATVLMVGSAAGHTEPLTWIRTYKGGRVFYTALGHPDDFEQPAFRRLLVNAIFWAMDRPVPED